MSNLVEPHGGQGLKSLLLPQTERGEELERARGLRKVPMTSREVSDVLMMAMGAYTPIDGFMGEADWRGVCLEMRLQNGVFWPIPVTLSCDESLAESVQLEEESRWRKVFNWKKRLRWSAMKTAGFTPSWK
jgi:sulfate adenylyltransferase